MRGLLMLMLVFVLAACGGGSGGGSSAPSTGGSGSSVVGCTDPLASNYDPSATTNDGSCRGGNGNSSFYGFNRTISTAIEGVTVTPDDTRNIVVPNEFYLQVGDGNEASGSANAMNRTVAAAIHTPICRSGASDYEYYSLVSLGGTGATAISLLIQETMVTISEHSFHIGNNQRFEESSENFTSNCYRGKVTISNIDGVGGTGELYENGDMIVLKSSQGLYVGIRGLSLTTTSSIAGPFFAYGQTSYSSCGLTGCGSPTVGTWSATNSANEFSSGGAETTHFGSGAFALYSHSGTTNIGSNTSHGVIEGSGNYLFSLVGTVGGQSVFLGSMPRNSDCSVAANTLCTGAAGVIVGIQ